MNMTDEAENDTETAVGQVNSLVAGLDDAVQTLKEKSQEALEDAEDQLRRCVEGDSENVDCKSAMKLLESTHSAKEDIEGLAKSMQETLEILKKATEVSTDSSLLANERKKKEKEETSVEDNHG